MAAVGASGDPTRMPNPRPRIAAKASSSVKLLYTLNHIEMALVGVIVFVAAFMARGFGLMR